MLPVQYGGPMDGDMVPLCASHHTEVHRLHGDVIKGKLTIGSIADPIMRELVNLINKQYVEFAQTGMAPDARRRVVLHCSQEELDMVHFLRDNGGYNSIDAMVKTWIKQRYDATITGKD